MDWTSDAWSRALTAMRERASVAEMLTLYDGGVISVCEVLEGAWSPCHDNPAL